MRARGGDMNCPRCGRFMKLSVSYSNDHDDSWEERWRCTTHHPTPEQMARSAELVAAARQANQEREAGEVLELFLAARLTRENRS